MSFARMVAGWTLGDDAVESVEVTVGGHLTDTGVEDWAVASLLFAGGFTANVRAGTRLADDMQAHIYGSEGHLRIPNPWTPGKDGNEPTVMLSRLGDDEPRILPIASAPLFGAEIDALWEARDSGEAPRHVTTRQRRDDAQP